MNRLSAYAKQTPAGVVIDVEGMVVDLITALKAGQCTKTEMLDMLDRMYDEVEVHVKRPTDN